MPAKIRKVSGKYQVRTPGGIKAKGTSKVKAVAQAKLLAAIEHDPSFRPRKKKRDST